MLILNILVWLKKLISNLFPQIAGFTKIYKNQAESDNVSALFRSYLFLNHSFSHDGDSASTVYRIYGGSLNGKLIEVTPIRIVDVLSGWSWIQTVKKTVIHL